MKPNSKTRIFVDCHVFDGNFQGTTTYLKGIYLEMIKDDSIHFYFAANNIENIAPIFGQQENISYLQYQSNNKFFRLLFHIPKMIRQNKINYAHFQYIVPPIKNCKYIVTIHDVLFLDFPEYFPLSYRIKNKFLFKWSAKRSDIVLTVSEFSKKQIQKYFRIKDITITPNAVDLVYFKSYDKQQIKQKVNEKYGIDNYWLYTSRWEPRKNHHTLLEVFVENEFYKDYSLVFIGDKAIENQKYDTYYSGLSEAIKSRIITLNKIDFQELLLLLRGADLSVYPSYAEGFGIPPIEAIAAKIPSICSNTTAMSDFHFMKAFQFDPYDKQSMLHVIQKTLDGTNVTSLIEDLKTRYNWNVAVNVIKSKIDFPKK